MALRRTFLLRSLSSKAHAQPHRVLSPLAYLSDQPPPRPAFDTHDIVSRLERSGFSPEQAIVLKTVLNDTILASVAEAREDIAIEAQKGIEVINTRLESQHRLTQDLVKHEIERFKAELERTRVDFKYEQDKANANTRLDLNLEKGRVKELVQSQDARVQELKQTYQATVSELRTMIERSKLDGVKYNIATIISILTLGLVVSKVLSMTK